MEEIKAINPGYSNQIIPERIIEAHQPSQPSYIANGNLHYQLLFESTPRFAKEYIAVDVLLKYVERGDDYTTEAVIVSVKGAFRLIKYHDFSAEDLSPILLYCKQLLNLCLLESPEILRLNNRPMPDYQQMKSFERQLESLAHSLNHPS